ncbi:trophoblast glycoprotein-like [Conger conger]|uniref:trophoblast glycoprotein-like n=1 Tax=Conger conger TaxID=82655 RepID=UPI002A5ABDE1|nr:trophoblast glycoprotein-like [Conger conger]
MMVFSWLLFCGLLHASVLHAACPARCECSEAAQTVKCVSKDLRHIPTGIPGYTRNLFITGNHISRIGSESFKGLDNVTTLSLSNNGITELESQAFSGLHSLLSLDLSSNRLAVIHPEALTPPGRTLRELNLSRALRDPSAGSDLSRLLRLGALSALRGLDLSSNALGALPSDTFRRLPALRRLLLANNSLAALRNGTLSGLERLEELDLSRNAFRTFRGESLGELERVPQARLLLAHNPLSCSCAGLPLARWLNGSRERAADAEGLACAWPPELRNSTLLEAGGAAGGCLDESEGDSEGADLALQTSYVFLGVVLGFVGVVFLFVLYLNRKGIKRWMFDTRDACREALEGYHYRMEVDSDPRLSQVSTTADL